MATSFWPQWGEQPVYATLCSLVLVSFAVWAGVSSYERWVGASFLGMSDHMPPSIIVSAQGDADVRNDIATVDLGVTLSAATSAEAQKLTIAQMNLVTAAMRAIGIEDADLKTDSYSVYPRYDYDQSPPRIVGYESSQSLNVRIRQESWVNEVLARAGELGVTNIGDIQFSVDDDSLAEDEARTEAITKARAQAEQIAASLGASLGDVSSYSEQRGGMYPYAKSYAPMAMMDSEGSSYPMPDISSGESEVVVDVYITYQLR